MSDSNEVRRLMLHAADKLRAQIDYSGPMPSYPQFIEASRITEAYAEAVLRMVAAFVTDTDPPAEESSNDR
jgi:hypothetical protein